MTVARGDTASAAADPFALPAIHPTADPDEPSPRPDPAAPRRGSAARRASPPPPDGLTPRTTDADPVSTTVDTAASPATTTAASPAAAGTAATTGAAVDVTATADSPCGCGCGCRGQVSHGTAFPAAVRARLKCRDCVDAGHGTAPASDDELDAEAARINDDAFFAEQKARWRDRVPVLFRDATSQHPVVLDRLARVRAGAPGGMLVIGKFGEGKTYLGMGFLNALVDQRLVAPGEIQFGSEEELIAQISTCAFADRQALRARLFDHRKKVFLIDDVGWGKFLNLDYQHALWREFLDFILEHGKHLVLTANLNRVATRPVPGGKQGQTEEYSPIKEWVGPAAYDRLLVIVGRQIAILDDGNVREILSRDWEEGWAQSEAALAAAAHATAQGPSTAPARPTAAAPAAPQQGSLLPGP